MSEMLGNRYFLVRNFKSAALQYEVALDKISSTDIEVLKKLIICYTKVNRIKDALKYFFILLKKNKYGNDDLKFINQDSPCEEIIREVISETEFDELQFSTAIKLGILYSFCNYTNGIKYFKTALEFSRNRNIIEQVINILEGKKQRSNN